MIGGDREVGELDWKRIGVRGSKDAILGFVGAFGAGHLARWALPYFARLLLSRLTPDQYALVAERFGVDALTRTPQVFLNKVRAFLLDFFAGAGITPITSAVQVALDQMSGHTPPSWEEFKAIVFENAIKGGLIQLLLAPLTHGSAAGSGSKTNRTAATNPPSLDGCPSSARAERHVHTHFRAGLCITTCRHLMFRAARLAA
jgi:hypothetical protein